MSVALLDLSLSETLRHGRPLGCAIGSIQQGGGWRLWRAFPRGREHPCFALCLGLCFGLLDFRRA